MVQSFLQHSNQKVVSKQFEEMKSRNRMTGVNNKNMTIKLAEMYINRELVGDSDSNMRFFFAPGGFEPGLSRS